jgi:hypothetical protein
MIFKLIKQSNMNSTMINTAEAVKNELIQFAQQFYGTELKQSTVNELLLLPIDDQIWLLNQYKEEVSSVVQPDLANIY